MELDVTEISQFSRKERKTSKKTRLTMSDILKQAVDILNKKLTDSDFSGLAKFVVLDKGSILIKDGIAKVSDDPADVTLSADADTFESILTGSTDPTSAFMTGKLALDGNMGIAMQLASALSS
jgi:putative sterol carrier protein